MVGKKTHEAKGTKGEEGGGVIVKYETGLQKGRY